MSHQHSSSPPQTCKIVIAWLHIQCPELKLPKALALKCWINHLDFLHTTANHLRVRLTLPPLIIKIERREAFFSCLAAPLALINGAPLLENYTGNVTLRKRVGAQPGLHLRGWKGFVQFFVFSLRRVSRGISRNNCWYNWLPRTFLCYLCANISGILTPQHTHTLHESFLCLVSELRPFLRVSDTQEPTLIHSLRGVISQLCGGEKRAKIWQISVLATLGIY